MKINNEHVIKKLEEIYEAEFFIDFNGKEFMKITLNGNTETIKIGSKRSKAFIRDLINEHSLGKLGSHQLDLILDELSSKAYSSGLTKQTFIRVAPHLEGSIVDLIKNGFCVITGKGYEICKTTDAIFYRPNKMNSLPLPIKMNVMNLPELMGEIVNLKSADSIYLILAYVVKTFLADSGANPILIFQGGQGTGKSTSTNNVKRIVDPTTPLLVGSPSSIRDLGVMAYSSHVIAFDNISFLSNDIADTLCRLSTGGGISNRSLYTDDEESTWDLIKPMIINGIDDVSTRPDLSDRSIVIQTKPLNQKNRISEVKLKEKFNNHYPYLIGAFFELTSKVMELLPNITTEGLPRMTEYCRVGIAIEKIFNLESGSFLRIYSANSNERIENAFWNDEVCAAIYGHLRKYASRNSELARIKGTLTEIREKLRQAHFGDKPKYQICKNVRSFSSHLKRIEPLLNGFGILIIQLPRKSNAREYEIKFNDETLKFIEAEELAEKESLRAESVL